MMMMSSLSRGKKLGEEERSSPFVHLGVTTCVKEKKKKTLPKVRRI